VSERYHGSEGEAYFAWQRGSGPVSAVVDVPAFQAYVGPEDAVLDFGCGSGALVAALSSGPKFGVEVNASARREASEAGVDVVASTGELAVDSIDVVISNHALEHVFDPLAELRLLRGVLKPGGRLVLRLPLDDWRAQRDPADDGNHHLFAWTPRLIANLVREAGFRVERSEVVTHAWPPRAAATLVERLPPVLFDLLARATAVVLRRRQLLVVARRPA